MSQPDYLVGGRLCPNQPIWYKRCPKFGRGMGGCPYFDKFDIRTNGSMTQNQSFKMAHERGNEKIITINLFLMIRYRMDFIESNSGNAILTAVDKIT